MTLANKGQTVMRAVIDGTMTLQQASCDLTDLSVLAEENGHGKDEAVDAWILRPALRLYEHEHGDWTDDEIRAVFAKWLEAP